MKEERRRSPRFHIQQAVEITYESERFIPAKGVDLSVNGILLETSENLDYGNRVYLMMSLDDGSNESFSVEGIVVRVEQRDGLFYIGIDFTDYPNDTKERLENYFKNLDK